MGPHTAQINLVVTVSDDQRAVHAHASTAACLRM